jgi:hypothetical protein
MPNGEVFANWVWVQTATLAPILGASTTDSSVDAAAFAEPRVPDLPYLTRLYRQNDETHFFAER